MSAIFSCREAARLASEALDHPLGARGRLELRLHLAVCSACRAYRRQLAALDALFRGRTSPLELQLSPEARERIRQAMRGAS